MVWQMIQKIVWQMIQIWGGKRYKKDVANDTKYGVADDRMADETQPPIVQSSEKNFAKSVCSGFARAVPAKLIA